MIPNGYYIKARIYLSSKISTCPPHVREVWDWLLMSASHEDNKYCKRGQVICNYANIQEDLKWFIGWRKKTYSHMQIAQAMKTLRKLSMITTRKTTRNTIVTITNYHRYQDPNNYKSTSTNTTRNTFTEHSRNTTLLYNNKELKNKHIVFDNIELQETFNEFIKMRNKIKKPLTDRAVLLIKNKLDRLYPNQINKQIACLNQSIENCWQTIYPIKVDSNQLINIQRTPPKPTIELSDEERAKNLKTIEEIRKKILKHKNNT